ncbi:MAG: response regulator [Chroococcidiopsidaceae cyanobacterium CP_BM_ER_R8_30]|nr:response regulator [Chroococcidiopsidaceae cyanobacterium CP_BM_ER_R8_30]
MSGELVGTYNLALVAVSFATSVIAPYTALDLASRVQSSQKWRWLFWFLGGTVAMSTGIWSTHFVAMLAFQLPQPVNYSVGITFLSLVCAISASGIALWLLSHSVPKPPLLIGSMCMGIAIVSMHYTGMAAMRLQARIEYDWRLVVLSIVIAISASIIALWLAFQLQNKSLQGLIRQKLVSAVVMGVAISGMHYTGMWATHFAPQTESLSTQSLTFDQFQLGITISIATLFILGLALVASLFDQQLAAQQIREQALKDSEERFRMLIREMQVGVLLLNANAEILIYNQAAISLLELKSADVLLQVFGKDWQLLREDGTPFAIEELPVQRVIALLQPIHDVVVRIEPAGSQKWRWLLVNAEPQIEKDGHVERVICTFSDITSQKQAETVLQRSAERERAIANIIQQMRQTLNLEAIFAVTTEELRQALKCDRVLIYRFNSDWSGEFVSESVAPGWKTLMQKTIQQAELTQWFAPSGSSDSRAQSQIAVNQEGCVVKTLGSGDNLIQDTYLQETQGDIYRKGKAYICVSDIYQAGFTPCYIELLERFQARAYITAPILYGDKLWGLLATYQNHSPRSWEADEILMVVQIGTQVGVAIQQAEILAKTQYQAEDLKKAKEAADAANRAKSSFLAKMSHELRTPLNAILGFTQLMNREGSLSPEHQQYLDIISHSGELLLRLINDVLEMSKIEAGRTALNETNFDLYHLLNTLEDMLQLKACDKGLELTFDCEPGVPQYIKTDENKLCQVLINLLGNAIKFTEQGYVMLRVSLINRHGLLSQDKEQVTIGFEVKDTGPGIAPAELDKLFEPFEQTETGLKSLEGTGLGLPISQNFVHLMGGEITVSSQPGVGSTFRFAIQAAFTTQKVVETHQLIGRKVIGLAPRQPKYRILVAEDDSTNRLLLIQLLSVLGFEVREAKNGQEALAVWEQWEPHLIWMDMRMPVIDGYEVTKQIKASSKGQSTIVIALTASVFEEQRRNSLLAGCNDFLPKPFSRDELLAKLARHLNVQYIYEANDRVGNKAKQHYSFSSSILHPANLQVMSTSWLEQLYTAALQCNDQFIFELVEQIPQTHSSLAIALKNLTENFLFDQIATLVQQAKKRESIDLSNEFENVSN